MKLSKLLLRIGRLNIANSLILFTMGYLFVTWSMVFFIDVLNIFDMQNILVSKGWDIPFLFWIFFTERGPTEILQWIFLFAGFLTCGLIISKEQSKKDSNNEQFFFLVGIGVFLMFLEDTINIRHIISYSLSAWVGYDYYVNPARLFTEFTLYFLIGSLMVYPLIKYWHHLIIHKKSWLYLIIGYLAYAVASFASASRDLFNWYEKTGDFIVGILPISNEVLWDSISLKLIEVGRGPLEFYLMDYLFEESLELIGAGFLLAFLLSYLTEIQNKARLH